MTRKFVHRRGSARADEVLESIWLFLPAGIANAAPPVLTWLLGEGRAIDHGVSWRGKPLLGSHKSWRGLVGGTNAGAMTAVIQRKLDHRALPFTFGVAISAGALSGDLVKSFAKRRLAVAPGRSWFPFDQLDYMAGAVVLGARFVRPRPPILAATVGVYFGLHVVVSAIGYAMGIKSAPM